jgi:hypothetical protein
MTINNTGEKFLPNFVNFEMTNFGYIPLPITNSYMSKNKWHMAFVILNCIECSSFSSYFLAYRELEPQHLKF